MTPGPGGASATTSGTAVNVSIDVAGVHWKHVALVGGAILAIIGVNLPWVSAFFLSLSGVSISYLLTLEELILFAFIVLTALDAFAPSVTQKVPMDVITLAVTGFALFLTVARIGWTLIDSFSVFSFVGPFVTFVGNALLIVVALLSRPGHTSGLLTQPVVAKH
ncbi:MAG: hypothetical protein ACP5OV_08655 [Acidimicrobiales bacterium]